MKDLKLEAAEELYNAACELLNVLSDHKECETVEEYIDCIDDARTTLDVKIQIYEQTPNKNNWNESIH